MVFSSFFFFLFCRNRIADALFLFVLFLLVCLLNSDCKDHVDLERKIFIFAKKVETLSFQNDIQKG